MIIAMFSYGVYNSYMDSQPEVFDLKDYKVTGPAGSHYHQEINGTEFYLGENFTTPVFDIGIIDMNADDFNALLNSYNNGEISKTELLDLFSDNPEVNMKALDFNVGDFRGEPEISILCQNPYDGTKTILLHMILHNNDKVFGAIEFMDNPVSTQMYNSVQLK